MIGALLCMFGSGWCAAHASLILPTKGWPAAFPNLIAAAARSAAAAYLAVGGA